MPRSSINQPWDLRRVITVVLTIVAIILMRECGGTLLGLEPEIKEVQYSSADGCIEFDYTEIRRRGAFVGHRIAVNGVFIVDHGDLENIDTKRITDKQVIMANQFHDQLLMSEIVWSSRDPDTFRNTRMDEELKLSLFGKISIGPLPQNVRAIIEEGNAEIVVAVDDRNFVSANIPLS